MVSLESPSGNEVVLFSNICAGEQDFNLGFLDGTNPEIDCPATTGELYAPEEFLSAFEGEDAQGTWTLNVNDVQNGGGGQLNAWSLQICYEENVFSTNNTKDPELSIFPNPTSDFITISSKDGNIDEMLVYDISGRLLDRILVNLVGGTDLGIAKVNEIISQVSKRFNSREDIVFGAVIDESRSQGLEITLSL